VTATSAGGTEATSTGTGVSTGWQRLHPLSPVLRGGRLLALAVLVVVRQSVETLQVDNGRDAVPYLLGVPVVAVLAVVQWRTTRWRVEDGDFRLETGVLRRRSRRVPLARLQAVDLVRPPLARLTGLAELRLQAVGHDGAEAGLAYLSLPEAHRVRAELLHLAGAASSHRRSPVRRRRPRSHHPVCCWPGSHPACWRRASRCPGRPRRSCCSPSGSWCSG